MPMIEVMTPTARTNNGNMTPRAAPSGFPSPPNAKNPRIMAATSVTS
jgi:hypothetical protein